MKLFLLFASIRLSCGAVQLLGFLLCPPIALIYFLSLSSPLVIMFSVLKQANYGKQCTMFEYVLTPHLYKA